MENNEINEEELKKLKLLDSKFSAYLIEKQINETVKEKWKRFQFPVYAIIAVLAFFGYDMWNKIKDLKGLKNEFKMELTALKNERANLNQQLESKTEDIKNKLDSQNVKLSLQTGEFHLQDRQLNLQDKTFEQNTSYSKLYSDIFNDQLQQTKILREDLQKSTSKFSGFTDSINKKIIEYRSQFASLTSLRDSLSGKIDHIERKADQNFINASLKYIYAERSDRLTETFTNPYKPSMYFLPGKLDTLTFVFFHAAKKGRAGKLVQIDVYRNKVKLVNSPIEIEEKNGDLIPHNIPIQIGNDIYNIEPVFIYLPPNIGGVLLIPDFVVLKITLQKN